jgi:hypothetical protein
MAPAALAAAFLAFPAVAQEAQGVAPSPPAAHAGSKDVDVHVRIIDKVLGQPKEFVITTGSVGTYGTLSVYPERCSSNGEGAYAALLNVYEQPPSGEVNRLFSGWMFSHLSSLTSVEHSFYDVSLVRCAPRTEKKSGEKDNVPETGKQEKKP